jgi:putative MFS transporter
MNDLGLAPSSRASVVARIDRLPPSRYLAGFVGRIAAGGWFEFYEFFMPGFILLGLTRSGVFTLENKGLLDYHSFASFMASFFVGMLISTTLFGFVSDRLGRRPIFVWSMVVYSLAQFAVGVLSDPLVIDAMRFVGGLAVGMQLINNDSYIAEIVPRHLRGRYMALAYVFILTAVPVAAFIATVAVPYAPLSIAGWRIVVLAGALSGVAVWFAQRGLPESPRWLEMHGRSAEADSVISEIERRIVTEQGQMLREPDTAAPMQESRGGAWHEMFGAFYLRRTVAISMFQFCQTIVVYGFTAFIPVLLVRQGFTVVHSLAYTFAIVLLTPVGGALGAFLAERIERKWQLVLSALLIAACSLVFAEAHQAVLIMLSGGLIAVGNNWMIAIFHPYAAELFPTRIRAQAIGLTFAWSRVSAIFVGYWATDLLDVYGPHGVFVMIGAALAGIIFAVGVLGPRTNGLSLEALSP